MTGGAPRGGVADGFHEVGAHPAVGQRLPAGSWDCHFHVLKEESPVETFSDGKVATSLDRLVAMHDAIGVAKGILVQSMTQDWRDFLRTLVGSGGRYLGVVAPASDMDDGSFASLAAAGVVGARFSHGKRGELDAALLSRVGELGWIPHFGLKGAEQASHWRGPLLGMRSDFVVEHSGWPDIDGGLQGAGFRQVLEWLDTGRCWVKITARFSGEQKAPFPDVAAFNHALAEYAPERILWGSDWPFTGYPQPLPSPSDVAACPSLWSGDENRTWRILTSNPAKLFANRP